MTASLIGHQFLYEKYIYMPTSPTGILYELCFLTAVEMAWWHKVWAELDTGGNTKDWLVQFMSKV